MDSGPSLGDPRLREHTHWVVKGLFPGPVNSYQYQIADQQTAKSRYQTGKLAVADCRTGNDWKT